MGNQIDRLAHHRYDEVPLSDPSYPDSENGSACVDSDTNTASSLDVRQLHNGDEEEEEVTSETRAHAEASSLARAYDYEEHVLREELHFAAYCAGECIFRNASSSCSAAAAAAAPSPFLTPARLLEASVAGDLLEFTAPGGGGGGSSCTHWAVSTGDGRAVYLHHGEVRSDPVAVLSAGRRGRVVSDWYRFKAQSAETVVRRALDQVLLQQQQQQQQEAVMVNGGGGGGDDDEGRQQAHGASWRNSECFAAWCRYGKRQFKSGLELRIGKTPYLLKTHLGDGVATTQSFQCLEDLIVERWRLERIGRSSLLLDSGFAQTCCGL
ncbi:unnamed protein product [Lampetra planeri]